MQVKERVHDAFDDPETLDAFGKDYLDRLYANWFENARSLRRALFFALLTALSFLLLNQNQTGTFTLGPLKTENISSVLTILPAIFSFLMFEAIDLTVAVARYRGAARTLIYKMHPSVCDNDLELLLEPPTTFAWGGGSSTALTRSTASTAKRLKALTMMAFYMTNIVFVLFLVYAYFELLNSEQTSFAIVLCSLLFAAFNGLRALLVLKDHHQEVLENTASASV